jgi:hypothetical protein
MSTPDVLVLPVWVDVQGEAYEGVLPYVSALKRGLTITVGEPFQVSHVAKRREARTDVLVQIAHHLLYTT